MSHTHDGTNTDYRPRAFTAVVPLHAQFDSPDCPGLSVIRCREYPPPGQGRSRFRVIPRDDSIWFRATVTSLLACGICAIRTVR